jgi:hypothetical protein
MEKKNQDIEMKNVKITISELEQLLSKKSFKE